MGIGATAESAVDAGFHVTRTDGAGAPVDVAGSADLVDGGAYLRIDDLPGNLSEALDELETAAGLNPNLAVVYCGLGDTLAYDGRIDQAIPKFERAINLSPHDPMRWAFYAYRALAHLFARDFDLAEEWARQATRVSNCHYWGYAHRVAALGHLQRKDDLRQALAELQRINPAFTCEVARKRLFYVKDPNQVALYLEGLRRAGVAEG